MSGNLFRLLSCKLRVKEKIFSAATDMQRHYVDVYANCGSAEARDVVEFFFHAREIASLTANNLKCSERAFARHVNVNNNVNNGVG